MDNFKDRIKDCESKYNNLMGQKQNILDNIVAENNNVISSKNCLSDIEMAQKLLQKVATQLQNKLSIKINEFVTYALVYVFESDKYKFDLEFVEKRGKTEVEMKLTTPDGGVMLDSINDIATGGGVLNVIAFALRIALWHLQTNKENFFIMDEPFANISADRLGNMANLVQEISERMGVQFIFVSHLEKFNNEKFIKINVQKVENVSKIVEEGL